MFWSEWLSFERNSSYDGATIQQTNIADNPAVVFALKEGTVYAFVRDGFEDEIKLNRNLCIAKDIQAVQYEIEDVFGTDRLLRKKRVLIDSLSFSFALETDTSSLTGSYDFAFLNKYWITLFRTTPGNFAVYPELTQTQYDTRTALYRRYVVDFWSKELYTYMLKNKSSFQHYIVDGMVLVSNSSVSKVVNKPDKKYRYDNVLFCHTVACNAAYKFDAFENASEYTHNAFDLWNISGAVGSELYNDVEFDWTRKQLYSKTRQKNKKASFLVDSSDTADIIDERFCVWNNGQVLGKNQRYFVSTADEDVCYRLQDNETLKAVRHIPMCTLDGSTLRRFEYPSIVTQTISQLDKAIYNNNIVFVLNAGDVWLSDDTLLLKQQVKLPETIVDIQPIADGCLAFGTERVFRILPEGTFLVISEGRPSRKAKAGEGFIVSIAKDNGVYIYTAEWTQFGNQQIRVQKISDAIEDKIFANDCDLVIVNDCVYIASENEIWGFANGGWTKKYTFDYKIHKLFTFNGQLLIYFVDNFAKIYQTGYNVHLTGRAEEQ